MSNFNFLLFGVYPYVALAVFIIGSWARFDLSQYTWKAHSSQLMGNKGMRLASNLFHIGILFIFAGHFVGLLIPESIYHYVITTSGKQILAVVSGGFFGILCLIGLVMLLHRRMTDPRVRAQSSFSDIMILWVLLAQLLLGLTTIFFSVQHLDGSMMVMLANWAQYTLTLQPLLGAAAIEPVGLIYKLHVFLGLSLFVLFPFTRLVHIISAPVWYLGRNYQIVRLKANAPARPAPVRPARASASSSAPQAGGKGAAPAGGGIGITSGGIGSPRPAAAHKEQP
ncbi:MAG: respiratory nitrate reductase subunit gamma [Halopseudomonas sp.]